MAMNGVPLATRLRHSTKIVPLLQAKIARFKGGVAKFPPFNIQIGTDLHSILQVWKRSILTHLVKIQLKKGKTMFLLLINYLIIIYLFVKYYVFILLLYYVTIIYSQSIYWVHYIYSIFANMIQIVLKNT